MCARPPAEQESIDRDLRAHISLSKLSRKWKISRESLRNHEARHITPALQAIGLAVERSNGHSVIADHVRKLSTAAGYMYEAARQVANMPLALRAHREQRLDLELLAKLEGELDESPQVAVVNLLQTPAFVAIREIVFEELDPYPEVRARISHRLRVLADQAEQNGA